MRIAEGRQFPYVVFCWLYISIGVSSLALGGYMVHLSNVLGKESPKGILLIAWILIVFGPIRIANSIWVLNKIRKRGKSSSAPTQQLRQ